MLAYLSKEFFGLFDLLRIRQHHNGFVSKRILPHQPIYIVLGKRHRSRRGMVSVDLLRDGIAIRRHARDIDIEILHRNSLSRYWNLRSRHPQPRWCPRMPRLDHVVPESQ